MMRSILPRGVLALVIPLLFLAAPSYAEDSRLDTVIKRDKLIVGTFSTSPPLSYKDDNGEFVGFEIDLVHLIAKYLLGDPNKVEFVAFTSDGRWPAVLSGKVDFGIAGTTIYPDRAARVLFTSPYMDSGISVLVRDDAHVNSLAELNDEKFTLAELNNPQMADRAKRFLPKMKTLDFDQPSSLFIAVKSGQAQAMQIDTPIIDWYAANNPGFHELPELLSNVQNNAIFMKPGDFVWWRYLDTVVQELRWGSRYDEYTALYQKWFKKNPPPQRPYLKQG
ncbi:MAG TPA: transporter substrate-binding domain-containing protein [Stellaceae bacterium]|jgi:polar amino acid transport system substrate-binding protein|nr:transporter substrate-binding domain-containing protein [Stellaceae bacterium]